MNSLIRTARTVTSLTATLTGLCVGTHHAARLLEQCVAQPSLALVVVAGLALTAGVVVGLVAGALIAPKPV